MKKQNRFYLYLTWPKYLAQWYAHEMYRLRHIEDETLPSYIYNCDVEVPELEPVQTLRGSAERNILELCITKQPDALPAAPSQDATICIEIPYFLNRPPETYNYLRPQSQSLLEATVRNHFRLELTKFINKMLFTSRVIQQGGSSTFTQVIEAFMDLNGIENTETNALAIKQTWQRLYWKEYKSHKKGKHENTGS